MDTCKQTAEPERQILIRQAKRETIEPKHSLIRTLNHLYAHNVDSKTCRALEKVIVRLEVWQNI